jgi:hypothetical protein
MNLRQIFSFKGLILVFAATFFMVVPTGVSKSFRLSGPENPDCEMRTYEAYQNQITFCWEKWIAHNPSFKGEVLFNLEIIVDKRTGKTIRAEIAPFPTENEFSELRTCVIRQIERWAFETSKDVSVKVLSVPLEFR